MFPIRQRAKILPTGYARAGYCAAAWSPPVGTHNVNHALMSFGLARLPVYPEYSVEFIQWSRESGSGVLYAGDPYAVRLFLTLSWPSIRAVDRDNLETFFCTIARAQSESWVWYSPEQGQLLPVRFADAVFPNTPEVGFGYHRLSGLRLMVDVNYSGLVPTGAPVYSAAMGTALSIGDVVMRFPAPQRPNTGYGVATRHTREDSSAGLPVVYRLGATTRRNWTLSWTNLDYYHCNWLLAFFMTYVRGLRRSFTWFDTDGTARAVRLAESKITIRQLGYNRFSCDLPLLEDI